MSLFGMMKQVAFTDTSVLLRGESGIGKGVFAKCLHANSARSNQAFVKFNGSIMDDATVEKALFGYEG